VALITGVTGQDGAYLAEFLLNKGYLVHGIKRRSSSFNTSRVDHLYLDPHEVGLRFVLHYGDMTDSTNLIRIVRDTQPDEIYNLAAQTHVQSRLKRRNHLVMSVQASAIQRLKGVPLGHYNRRHACAETLDRLTLRRRMLNRK